MRRRSEGWTCSFTGQADKGGSVTCMVTEELQPDFQQHELKDEGQWIQIALREILNGY